MLLQAAFLTQFLVRGNLHFAFGFVAQARALDLHFAVGQAMDNSACMGTFQCFRNLKRIMQGGFEQQRARAAILRPQFHNEHTILEPIDRGDVGVIEGRQ